MNFHDFIRIAKDYSALGSSVQDQLDDIIDGEPMDDMNPNALAYISDLIGDLECAGVEDALDLKAEIDEHLKTASLHK